MAQSLLSEEVTPDPLPKPDPLQKSAAEGREAWQRLGLRLRAVTPAQVMRSLLAAVVITAVLWLAWVARLALLPFVLGGILAYILLPLVNTLDHFMPRWFASLLTMGAVTAVLVYSVSQMVPLIIRQVYNVAVTIPTEKELTDYTDEFSGLLENLPRPVRKGINDWLEKTAVAIHVKIDSLAEHGLDLVVNSVARMFQALGFVFGFLVIPTWLLTVLNEQKRGKSALDRMMPASVKKDFGAIIRIIDRIMSTFVRGQFFISLAAGLLTYLGLTIVTRLVNSGGDYMLVLSLFTAIMAFVPILGPFLGAIPVILLGATISQEAAIAGIVMYVCIWLIINNLVIPQIEERLIDIHPAILIIIIVAVSELGFLWVLVAAPLTGILRDLFRYAYGRFANPPRPAGLLPHEPLPPQSKSRQAQPVPIAYRRTRARRSTQTNH